MEAEESAAGSAAGRAGGRAAGRAGGALSRSRAGQSRAASQLSVLRTYLLLRLHAASGLSGRAAARGHVQAQVQAQVQSLSKGPVSPALSVLPPPAEVVEDLEGERAEEQQPWRRGPLSPPRRLQSGGGSGFSAAASGLGSEALQQLRLPGALPLYSPPRVSSSLRLSPSLQRSIRAGADAEQRLLGRGRGSEERPPRAEEFGWRSAAAESPAALPGRLRSPPLGLALYSAAGAVLMGRGRTQSPAAVGGRENL